MLVDLAYPILLLVSYLQVQWFTVVCSIRLRLVYTKAQVLGVFQLRVGFSVFSVCGHRESKRGISEAREIRTPNLLIWSQTRCRCAIAP